MPTITFKRFCLYCHCYLLLLCINILYKVSDTEAIELTSFDKDWLHNLLYSSELQNPIVENNSTETNSTINSVTTATTNNITSNIVVVVTPMSDENNKSMIQPAECKTDEDCESFHIYSELSYNKVICDPIIHICIIAVVEEVASTLNNTIEFPTTITTTTKETTTTTATTEEEIINQFTSTTITTISFTKVPTSTPQVVVIDDSTGFHSIPIVVWILFTIPFISIIILGIICGKRLKMQSENIQENLVHATINGVHVDQLLSQRDLIQTIAFTHPPPAYEKATGEIPPGYETVLQSCQEKRQSIFQCDSWMDGEYSHKEHTCHICSAICNYSNNNNTSTTL